MRLFGDPVAYSILCSGHQLDEVLRDGRVISLHFGDPDARLRDRPGGNFSEQAEMVGIVLVENNQSSAAAGEVDAPGWSVIEDFIGAAYGVQRLHDFSCVRVYDHKLPRIDDVSAPQPAAHEQPMVSCIEACGMRLR